MTPKRLPPGMSAAVSTRTSPGCAAAGSEIAEAKNAWACGVRTRARVRRVRRQRVGAEFFRAVSFATPSTRASRAPTAPRPRSSAMRPRSLAMTLEWRRVRGFAAPPPPPPRRSRDIPCSGTARRRAHPRSRLGGRGFRASSAPAAISAAGVQMPHWAAPWAGSGAQADRSFAIRQAFDGVDAATLDLRDRRQAGAHLHAVHQHRAGAAVAGVAADLDAGEPQRRAADRPAARPAAREHDGLPFSVNASVPPATSYAASARRAASRRRAPHQIQRRAAPYRRSRGCRRSAERGEMRGRSPTPGWGAPTSAASSAGSRMATGEHAPTATRAG